MVAVGIVGTLWHNDASTSICAAIDLAENGYAVTVRNSQSMSSGGRLNDRGERVILSRGRGPLPGEILAQKDLARTFRRLLRGERRFL